MKSIIISIQPQWVAKILNGEKAIEVRKSAPKEVPFKAYIYCTKGRHLMLVQDGGSAKLIYAANPDGAIAIGGEWANGKIIGEFICDRVDTYESEFWDDNTYESIKIVVPPDDIEDEEQMYLIAENGEDNELLKSSCLSWNELRNYIGTDTNRFYGLHISELKIYDKPRELGEFRKYCHQYYGTENSNCEDCKYFNEMVNLEQCYCNGIKPITRPPQSWQYVEELK